MKLFRISEDDLARLEHVLPELCLSMYEQMAGPAAPRLRKQWSEVREIVANVRWDYGPPSEVEIIPAGE